MLTKMFYIMFTSFKKQCAYKISVLMNICSSIIFIAIMYYLWTAIYSSSGEFSVLALNTTISYVVIITLINKTIGKNTEESIGSRVVNGNIILDLSKPISLTLYVFCEQTGKMFFDFVFSTLPILIILNFVLSIKIAGDLISIFAFLCSIIFSYFLVFLFEFLIGLLSFFNNQIFGLTLLKSSIVGILAGLTVPLEFYPAILKEIVVNLPFQAMYYIPVAICLDLSPNDSWIQELLCNFGASNNIACLLAQQVIWILIFSIFVLIGWHCAKRRLVVQGG